MRKIIVIIDGLGDIDRTPLEVAKTPNMDFMAKNGITGLMYPVRGVAPESDFSQLSILGYPLSVYPGRGVVEALGIGLDIRKGFVYIRCNFAGFSGDKITSLRVMLEESEVKRLNNIDKDIRLVASKGYRCVMIVKGNSANISNTHPGYIRYKNISRSVSGRMVKKRCLGNKAVCDKINRFVSEAERLLKNRTILVRGAGNRLPKLKKLRDWCMIADMPVEIGLARLTGMRILQTGITELAGMGCNAYIQIKGPDTYGHEGDFNGKVRAIEQVDMMLKPLADLKNTLVCVTSDHSTPCSLKRHSADPVPILVYGNGKDAVASFSERACKNGSLGIIEGKDVMKMLNTFSKKQNCR